MTDIPLNTRIEWTQKDRERGKCPVPAGSDVTVWFEDGDVSKDTFPESWGWDKCDLNITAYMVHSMPQQPREWWAHPKEKEHMLPYCEGYGRASFKDRGYIHVREVLE